MTTERTVTQDPQTPAEWQESVDLAEFYMHLDSAVKYGLVEWKGGIDLERCEEILQTGAAVGITPTPGCVERITRAMVGAEK